MNYHKQLNRVIDYIGLNLDNKLTLDKLSEVACFSKYHFHRLFTAYTGLSVKQYSRWLRLKRAAHQLVVQQNSPIINIAIDAGFESHESFTRAFKQICGISPSEFRVKPDWSAWEKIPYQLPKQGDNEMNVDIKHKTVRRLAIIEHRGSPEKLSDSVNKLISWAKSKPTVSKPNEGESFGFAYDDPDNTSPDEFRFDLGITVPNNIKLDGEIKEIQLSAGRYAVATHKGSRQTIADTVYALYRNWLPNSGEELGDLPCVFCYHNFDHEVAETELVTECWLLLKN